jgi:electron transfer flavoprotein beta subunit
MPADLVLTGVQAIDDLDGLIAPLVAYQLELPYLGIVTRVSFDALGQLVQAIKEYPGGVHGEFEVKLPAVLGIQAAEKPPRYVPVAKVRTAMKSQKIDCTPVPTLADGGWRTIEVVEMKRNEPAGHAEMLEGDSDQVSGKLCGILAERGIF